MVSNGKDESRRWQHLNPVEMRLELSAIYNLLDNQQIVNVQAFSQRKVLAIAGIGNPERFFDSLRHLGLQFQSKVYPDHYAFQTQDFQQINTDIIMTEKDAVKCRAFAQSNFWVLSVSAAIKNGLMPAILNKISRFN